MLISSRRIGFAFVLIAAVAAGSASGASIVVNGDFENAVPFTGWTLTVDAGTGGGPYGGATVFNTGFFWDNGSTSVLGTDGHVAYVEVYRSGASGVTAESLTQSVSLEGGVNYQVSYEENARQIVSAGLQPLVEVFLDATSVVSQHAVSQVNAQGDSSNLFHAITSSTFTAPTSGSYLLEFEISAPAGDNDLTALFDNIAITALPEPTSCALLGIGACATMTVRRRRGRSL